jgi:hypothetical protein
VPIPDLSKCSKAAHLADAEAHEIDLRKMFSNCALHTLFRELTAKLDVQVVRLAKIGQSAKANTHSTMMFTSGTNKSNTHQPL